MRTLLVIVVLVVFIGCITCSKGRRFSIELISEREKRVLPEIPVDMECIPHDGSGAVIVPLVSDDNNIFNIDLRIGEVWIRAAVDTGSEALVVSGEDCEKCQLNSDTQGTVPMSTNPTHLSTMRYGSQSDSVEWDTRPVFLKGWKATCSTSDDDGALTKHDKPPSAPVCIFGKVNLAVVKSRTGTSNYNVLGLGARSKYGPPAFLESMFPEPPRAFSMYIRDLKTARLVLHRPSASCKPPKHLLPIDKGDLSSHQHLIRFETMRANEEETILEDDTNKYRLMLDTGANAISLPSKVYNALKNMPTQKGTLTFSMMDSKNKLLELTFKYDMNDRTNAQILDSGGSYKIIVGVTFMVGLGVGIWETPTQRFVSIDW